MKFILGSSSTNRLALFNRMSWQMEQIKPKYDEIGRENEPTEEEVVRHAIGKAKSVYEKLKNEKNGDFLILSFDSMIKLGNESLGKAKDVADMTQMMLKMAGKDQEVVTGVCVLGEIEGKMVEKSFYEATKVQFREDVSERDCQKYAKAQDWSGKCGAWSVLGAGQFFIDDIDGDFQNIVGVPVIKLRKVIENMTEKKIWEVVELGNCNND